MGHILTDWVREYLQRDSSGDVATPFPRVQTVFVPSLQLPCLSAYTPYCSNQVKAKALLDQKKQDRRVQDFLQRCLQSPFSRKLDLWNFLDIPRSRLVKYPLLLREILKHTPNDHPDQQHLEEAVRKSTARASESSRWDSSAGVTALTHAAALLHRCWRFRARWQTSTGRPASPSVSTTKIVCCTRRRHRRASSSSGPGP